MDSKRDIVAYFSPSLITQRFLPNSLSRVHAIRGQKVAMPCKRNEGSLVSIRSCRTSQHWFTADSITTLETLTFQECYSRSVAHCLTHFRWRAVRWCCLSNTLPTLLVPTKQRKEHVDIAHGDIEKLPRTEMQQLPVSYGNLLGISRRAA